MPAAEHACIIYENRSQASFASLRDLIICVLGVSCRVTFGLLWKGVSQCIGSSTASFRTSVRGHDGFRRTRGVNGNTTRQ